MSTISRAGLTLVAGACLSLVASPAGAHPAKHDDHRGGEVAEAGEWAPVPEEFYAATDFEACGDTITIVGGDVRDGEERVSTLEDGATLIEFRGEVTVDLIRKSDRAMIDELDISGVGYTLISADGTKVKDVLFGASILFPTSEVEVEPFVEAFGTDLAYFTDPEEWVRIKVTVDPTTGEVQQLRSVEIDAHIVDLCRWFDRHHGDHGDHGKDHYRLGDHHHGDRDGNHHDARKGHHHD